MKRVLSLSTVQQAVRSTACAECGRRTPGPGDVATPRACEARCALFLGLPRLWDLAIRLDPMVGRFEPVMRRAVSDAMGPDHSAEGQESGRAFVRVLGELAGK